MADALSPMTSLYDKDFDDVTIRPELWIVIHVGTHCFLDHSQHRGGILVLGFAYEISHPFPDERLDLGVVCAVV